MTDLWRVWSIPLVRGEAGMFLTTKTWRHKAQEKAVPRGRLSWGHGCSNLSIVGRAQSLLGQGFLKYQRCYSAVKKTVIDFVINCAHGLALRPVHLHSSSRSCLIFSKKSDHDIKYLASGQFRKFSGFLVVVKIIIGRYHKNGALSKVADLAGGVVGAMYALKHLNDRITVYRCTPRVYVPAARPRKERKTIAQRI